MTWVKLDNQFFRSPKIVGVGPGAKLLYVAGLCYASTHLTDGRIPVAALALLVVESGASPDDVTVLADAGLWATTETGWEIVNYGEHQRSRGDVERAKNGNRERKAKARERANVTEMSQRDTADVSRECHSVTRDAGHANVTGLDTDTDTDTETISRDSIPYRLCDLLANLIEENGSKKPKITKAWVQDMDRLVRIDKNSPKEVARIIRWAQADSFWRSNILSPAKLRKQFVQLSLKAQPARSQGTGQPAWLEELDRIQRGPQ